MKKPVALWLTVIIALTAFFIGIGVYSLNGMTTPPIPQGNYLTRLDRCIKAFGAEGAKLGQLSATYSLCVDRMGAEDHMEEMALRRSAFRNQYAQLPVLLGLVVLLTISGIIFSAYQLYMSLNIPIKGNDISIDLVDRLGVEFIRDKDKLAFKTSALGLAVLVISFAFFYVFVTQVFLIDASKY